MIPFFIISYNNGPLVKETVREIKRLKGSGTITILDNNSSCSVTKGILDELEDVVVIRYEENHGPWRVLEADEFQEVREGKFVLTDPDLELKTLPDDALEILLSIQEKYRSSVVGLALDISDKEDIFDYSMMGHTIISYESRCWVDRLKDDRYELYNADIDTTFALYDLNQPTGSIRVADLAVRHLPWHKSFADELSVEELITMYGDSPFSTISSFILKYKGVGGLEESVTPGWSPEMFQKMGSLGNLDRDVLYCGANAAPAILFLLAKYRSVYVIDLDGGVEGLIMENVLLSRYRNSICVIEGRRLDQAKAIDDLVAFCVDEDLINDVEDLLHHCRRKGIEVVVNH